MGAAHHPRAGGHGAGAHPVDAQGLERGAGADDVDDRVEASDLVEVHLLGRAPVQAPLGAGEREERRLGAVSHTIGQARFVDEAGDVRVGPHHRRLRGAHFEARRRDATAQHRLCVDLPAADRDASEQRAHLFEVGARVDEGAERHVAGDPCEAVEPGRRPGRHRRMRATAHAAP